MQYICLVQFLIYSWGFRDGNQPLKSVFVEEDKKEKFQALVLQEIQIFRFEGISAISQFSLFGVSFWSL